MHRLLLALTVAILAITPAARAQYVGGYDDSHSIDASELLPTVQKLEANPLSAAAKNTRQQLFQQFTSTPGMGYLTCTGLFTGASRDAARNNAVLAQQLALGAYAFQYQHIGAEPDNALILQAGIESLLRAYRNLPGYSDPTLEALAKERDANTLLPHIRSSLLQQCKLKPNHFNG